METLKLVLACALIGFGFCMVVSSLVEMYEKYLNRKTEAAMRKYMDNVDALVTAIVDKDTKKD